MDININWNIVKNIIKLTGSAFAGGLITYITAFSKMKKEQRAKILGNTMEERRAALVEIKNTISELSIVERADIVHPESEFDHPVVYHHVFENYETLDEFFNKVNTLRRQYDYKVDGKVFLSLVALDKYLFEYGKVVSIGFNHNEAAVYTVGIAVYTEVNKWYKKFIWKIDKELNKPKYKYEKKYGFIYDFKLNHAIKKIRKTTLYKMFIIPMELSDEKIGEIFKESNKI